MALATMTEWAQELMTSGGIPILAALILLENLFPPIPSEAILPFAGYLVFDGTFGFVPALLAATAGSVAGALLLYALGRYGGRPLLLRHGRLLRLTPAKLDRADDWFDAHGPKVVFLGRLVPGVRSLVSFPAGASEMRLAPFVALTAAGSALWNTALIGAGWALGTRWRDLTGALSHYDVVIAAAVALGGAGWLFVHARRNRA